MDIVKCAAFRCSIYVSPRATESREQTISRDKVSHDCQNNIENGMSGREEKEKKDKETKKGTRKKKRKDGICAKKSKNVKESGNRNNAWKMHFWSLLGGIYIEFKKTAANFFSQLTKISYATSS